MQDICFQTVVTAALIHDIGKFLQRGNFGSLKLTGRHPEISRDFVSIKGHKEFFARFCDADMLAELVARHHESSYFPIELQAGGARENIKPYAYLVSRADNFSSAERDDGESTAPTGKRTALAAVFSRLQLEKNVSDIWHYKPERLSPDVLPHENADKMDETPYKKHLQGFGAEFLGMVQDKSIQTFDKFYNRLVKILQAYTWCVPSSTLDAVPDVSLYDHLRTTAAIAAAMYRYHQASSFEDVTNDGKAKFLLAVGDISGIQKYILRATTKGYGKIAKRLRARSFYLSILADVVSHMLLAEFDLPFTNIVMAAGGKFYVLLPNVEGAEERLLAIQQRVDRELLERYQGELALNLAWQDFSGQDFKDFGGVMGKLAEKLGQRKASPFERTLLKAGKWESAQFVRRLEGQLDVCPGCGKIHGEQGPCDDCLQDERLGTKLPKASYVYLYRGDYPNHAEAVIGDYAVTLESGAVNNGSIPYLAYNLNEKGRPVNAPEQVKYMAKHIPVDGQEPLGFDILAKKAAGSELLACFKADVDRLGTLFLLGFQTDDKNYATISRLSTLSRMLELYFSGWLEQILAAKYPDCYTIYSGGDDLLLIGPWNIIMDLAAEVNERFSLFAAGNPNITMSAGISLFKPRFPIDYAINAAEDLLEKSKETGNRLTGENRNQVSVFGVTMTWKEYTKVITEGAKVAKWLKDGKVKSGSLYRLLNYASLYERAVSGENEGWSYRSLLQYDLSRNGKNYGREAYDWLSALADPACELLPLVKPIVAYALYSNRGGNE